jgi:hypothetical protein
LSELQKVEDSLTVWEGEGGSLNESRANPLTGTVNQIEWAERIRTQVNAEFDRLASVLEAAALKKSEPARSDALAVIAILEDKRAEVMANQMAGYFIHDWQELRDQVRQMILNDAKYKAIQLRVWNSQTSVRYDSAE